MHTNPDQELEFRLGKKKILVRKKETSEHYFNCEYLCESSLELDFEDIKTLTPKELHENLYISTFFSNDTFKPANFFEIGKKHEKTNARIGLSFNISNWDYDISPLKFIRTYSEELEKSLTITNSSDKIDDGWFYIDIQITPSILENLTISENISNISKVLKSTQERVLHSLALNGICAQFNFPAPYRHAYSQYLIYFGQFLEDLGIEADVSLKSEEGTTTLQISPHSKTQAIREIHFALTAFLDLPDSASRGLITPRDGWLAEAKFLQLNAAIEHLNSQLKLQQAISNAHAANIQMLKQYIEKAKHPIESSNHIEPFAGFKITKYKGSFFEIDIPKLAKRLKFNLTRTTPNE
ncbi:hypothetical protein [Pseudomonas sediminis]|uniref:Uncharacterized protein n=1 Tax=Pseudomonas sediminis TaxID=1691904 RepID=A0A2G5FFN7_9PSED|nr:hypothetical protein [Pseudomonas sediminis]PIA66816.1 hypothetical protein CDO35_18680 [Pseudomonas sediminis]